MSTTIESQLYFHGDTCESLPQESWNSQEGQLYVAAAAGDAWAMVRPSSSALSTYTLPRWDTLLTNISLKYRPPFARFSSSYQDYLDVFQFTVSRLQSNISNDEVHSANASIAVEVIVSVLLSLARDRLHLIELRFHLATANQTSSSSLSHGADHVRHICTVPLPLFRSV